MSRGDDESDDLPPHGLLPAVPEHPAGLSARLLAERLRELIEAGIVNTHPESPRGMYYLTERGEDLREAFAALEAPAGAGV